MKIKMLQSSLGSPDGIEIKQYEADAVYDLPSGLANEFILMGIAEEFLPYLENRDMGPLKTSKRRK